MFSCPPHLTTFRPSPNTISFTVSTASPSPLHHHFALVLRVLVGLLTVLVLLARYFLSPSSSSSTTTTTTPRFLVPLANRVGTVDWTILAPVALGTLFLVFRRFYTEESLLTLRTLGLQTRTLSPCYLLPATTRFIPTTQIRDVFIHEAFRGFEVRYYLAVVVKEEKDVVVVFPNILPSLEIVQQVWRGARACLHEPPPSPEEGGAPEK